MREIQFIAYNSKDLYDTIMRYSVASKYDKLATSCIVLICHFSKKMLLLFDGVQFIRIFCNRDG